MSRDQFAVKLVGIDQQLLMVIDEFFLNGAAEGAWL
jgi:hypothetical protein